MIDGLFWSVIHNRVNAKQKQHLFREQIYAQTVTLADSLGVWRLCLERSTGQSLFLFLSFLCCICLECIKSSYIFFHFLRTYYILELIKDVKQFFVYIFFCILFSKKS